MGSRKRSKPNPPSESERPLESPDSKPSTEGQTGSPHPAHTPRKAQNGTDRRRDSSAGGQDITSPSSTGTKWNGSWARGFKSSPITQVARESISANNEIASTLSASAATKTTQSPASSLKSPALSRLSRSMKNSTSSLPLPATSTDIRVPSSASETPSPLSTPISEPPRLSTPKKDITESRAPKKYSQDVSQEDGTDSQTSPPNAAQVENGSISPGKAISDTSKWISWFSKPSTALDHDSTLIENTSTKIETNQSNSGQQAGSVDDPKPAPASEELPPPSSSNLGNPIIAQTQSKYWSWLGLWKDVAAQQKGNATVADPEPTREVSDIPKPQDPIYATQQISKPSQLDTSMIVQPSALSKTTGWAFWSKDRSQDGSSGQTMNDGKIAFADSSLQSCTENVVTAEAQKIVPKLSKPEKPRSINKTNEIESTDVSKAHSMKEKTSSTAMVDSGTNSTKQLGVSMKKDPANLVLPLFKYTYKAVGRPTLMQQLTRFLQYTRVPDTKHVSLLQDPARIRNAIAIGVHGYFPAPLIRSVLGQPTGTSIRFANGAATAIHKWTQNHGYRCEVEKIALEGEGKVAERIDLLWKLLLNWIEKIRKADFVMIACHSQGVPVAMMLVAKLVEFGCVNNARIGVCALAGINLGPFADYKSRWIGGSAGELFDFARLDSQVSKDYEVALGIALKFGVRVVYIGSIDDQLVSLESSTFGTIDHPYIYRAVFVDGRVHAPDFLTHLVGFALKLRNLGISDHGLIRELSSSLAGSLYSGEGHSRIYDEDSVYYLTVEYALETTSVGHIPLKSRRQALQSAQDPYILPFAMRGILEEDFVQTELHNESMELLRQFDDWKPTSKVLKDVKFRLEGVRSKL